MEKDLFYVSLKGDYHYQKGDANVILRIGKNIVEIKREQILFHTASNNQSEIEFLVKFTPKEYQNLIKDLPIPTIVTPVGDGNDSIPPKIAKPPRNIGIKDIKAFVIRTR